MLYNKEIKEQFILENARSAWSRDMYTSVLENISEIERQHQMDAAQMDLSLLLSEISFSQFIPNAAKHQHEATAEKYVKWARKHIDSFKNVSNDEKSVEEIPGYGKFVRNPKHLAITLERVFPQPELNTIQHVYRAYLWLAFSGLREEDAAKVESWNLDFDAMEIQLDGRKYPIYAESVYDLRAVCVANTINENIGRKKVVIKESPRADGYSILRGFETDNDILITIKNTHRTAVSKYFRKAKEKDIIKQDLVCYDLTYLNAYYSGIFFRMRELEELGIEPDFSKISDRDYDLYDEKHGYLVTPVYSERVKRTRKKNDLKAKYRNWKRIFNL